MSHTISIRFGAIHGTQAGLGRAGGQCLVADRPEGTAGGQGLGWNGAQLLAAAIGGCFWNDLHHVAAAEGVPISVDEVAVEVTLAGSPPRIVRAHGTVRLSGPSEAACDAVFEGAVAASTIANSISAAIPVDFKRATP